MTPDPWHLFEVIGVELEYMIVDAGTLDVRPVADRLLRDAGAGDETEVDLGAISWSNELALHVVELKTTDPVASLDGLASRFHEHVRRANALLEPVGARLLPTGMHPWMDPIRELRLWPGDQNVIYETFDRIFDCRGHGWANLQSVHLNLPFADDEEFGRLHAAGRLVLPIVPALAASSPYADGRATGLLDTRLEAYRHNARRVPSVTGRVVPERVFTRGDYESRLLGAIYDDLAPLDPGGILRHEWVNARGCIARFDRMSIELRVVDVQECPAADLAVVAAITEAIRSLAEGHDADLDARRAWGEETLEAIMLDCIRDGDEARLTDASYLRTLGYPGRVPCTARDLWLHLMERARDPIDAADGDEFVRAYGELGCLARRIAAAVGAERSLERLRIVYGELGDCLADGRIFRPPVR